MSAEQLCLRRLGGYFEGYVTELAQLWLDALTDEQRQEVEVFSCGPHPILEAVAQLAKDYDLPCQVSLEEFMACAVGGCAGCVVKVITDEGEVMKLSVSLARCLMHARYSDSHYSIFIPGIKPLHLNIVTNKRTYLKKVYFEPQRTQSC